jgi:multidrug efflux system membrane fusion protein
MRLRHLAVLLAAAASACKAKGTATQAAAPVTIAAAVQRDVPRVLEATGTVEPVRTARVEAQVSGLIDKVTFREGDQVTAGQVLFQIDPRPFRAALSQAEAALARDSAQWESARRDRDRFESLAAKEYVTGQQLDQAKATAAALEATLRSDQAAIDQARLSLQYATVRAPITGRAGSLLVREGNLVRAGSGDALVVINQMAPIRVRFSVPAAYLSDLRALAGQKQEVRAMPVGDTAIAVTGTLDFLDNAVDSMTGTITLKAEFANKDSRLWPGGLVRVRLALSVDKGAIVVPSNAVVTGQRGSYVYVIDSGLARMRTVTLRRQSDSIAVLSAGVNPGDQVVVDGQLRLTEGARVQVQNKGDGPGQKEGDS